MAKTVSMSPSGDVQLPKEFREADHLTAQDTFAVERLSPGQYLLQKLPQQNVPRATLVKAKNGLLVFRGPADGPVITSELVKRLEADTL